MKLLKSGADEDALKRQFSNVTYLGDQLINYINVSKTIIEDIMKRLEDN